MAAGICWCSHGFYSPGSLWDVHPQKTWWRCKQPPSSFHNTKLLMGLGLFVELSRAWAPPACIV